MPRYRSPDAVASGVIIGLIFTALGLYLMVWGIAEGVRAILRGVIGV